MIRTITSVIRGEGLGSAARRASERIQETVRDGALLARGAFLGTEGSAILNISAASVSARLGGVQAQLIARLRTERSMRTVALLHPGALEVSAPRLHARPVSSDFESAVRRALEITGARAIHLEGTDGVPLELILRLADSGIRVVVSLHDFSLFCARPHLLELPAERFCSYSHDLDRCERCLRRTFDLTRRDQAERRARGRELLGAATGLIFPSRFLLEQHRELFSMPELQGAVIEPGVAGSARGVAPADARSIAYAGSIKRHKGAHLLPGIIRGDAEWHVFGGGDENLLLAIRGVANVKVHGYYRQGRLPSLLARHGVGLVVLPSIVPESFSLVLSHAWLAGVAVAAFDLGAPAERIRASGGGYLAPLDSGADGLADIVEQWRSGRITTTIPRAIASPLDAARATVAQYQVWGLLPR